MEIGNTWKYMKIYENISIFTIFSKTLKSYQLKTVVAPVDGSSPEKLRHPQPKHVENLRQNTTKKHQHIAS